jgi:sortase A
MAIRIGISLKTRAIRLLGEVSLLVGVIICLYGVYQLWYSNLNSDRSAQQLAERLVSDFTRDSPAIDPAPPSKLEAQNSNRAIALLYIPKLKEDVWALPVLEDISEGDLALGAGHYPDTAMPGEIGNFAIAAHRATNGEPFAYFERLTIGDKVIVQTSQGFFTYELFADQKVRETETWVIAEKPNGVISSATAIITLTTCDPRWNSTQRWARWGKLVEHSINAPMELIKP